MSASFASLRTSSTHGRTGARGLWALGTGIALLGAVACNEIGTPLHLGFYGYSMIVTDSVLADTTVDGVFFPADTSVTDTLDFAWPGSSLPVKIWVQDTVTLRADMAAAVTAWQNVLVYGEFTATFVSDSTEADVIVRGNRPPPAPVAPGARRLSIASTIPPVAACEGGTDIFVSAPDHTKLWTPIRVYVIPKFPLSDPATAPCLARVSIHELGHALGLFRHSPDPLDIMASFPDTSVHVPSEGDATTILTLYHQHSDLRPRPATDTIPDSLAMVR